MLTWGRALSSGTTESRFCSTSRKTPTFDLGQLRSQGIEPTNLSVIGVKAAVAHRRAYDPIAVASYTVDTPGACPSDLTSIPYSRVRRPIYPLDEITGPTMSEGPQARALSSQHEAAGV